MAQTVYNSAGKSFQLEEAPLGTPGAEGAVFKVISPYETNNSCVKIYINDRRTPEKRKKLEYMISHKPVDIVTPFYSFCWPIELIFKAGEFIGYRMPLADHGSVQLYGLTSLKSPKNQAFEWAKFNRSTSSGMQHRLSICYKIALAVNNLHNSGVYSIIDYKPQNILITDSGKLSFIDVDSFQVSSNAIALHHGSVATPEYTPAEASTLNPLTSLIPLSWDRFSMAVSFYEMFTGIHPYAATANGQYSNANQINEKIRSGLFVHGAKRIHLTRIGTPHGYFSNLSSSLQALFLKAFEQGHLNPGIRPTASEWGQVLYRESQSVSMRGNLVAV